jgi:hypothetical protein
MSTLTRTTIVLVAVNLIMAGLAPAQNVSDKQAQDALAARKAAEAAAKVAQKQTEVAQKQMEIEKRQTLVAAMDAAQALAAAPEAPVVPAPPSVSIGNPWPLGSRSSGVVLVIPTAEIKTQDLVTITEDMTVMSRIFEKNLKQAHIETARGGLFLSRSDALSLLFEGRGGAIQSMYLQGYGALFLMKVEFPLSPPPQVEEKPETKKEEGGDAVWEHMREELYEPQEAARRESGPPPEKYDAEKVENLKTTLVKSLKHATNIRGLKPDESVILTVTGSGGSGGNTRMITTRGVIAANRRRAVVRQPVSVGTESPSHIMLVIRAKKSDIDSFAKGDLDYDQFRQRTGVFTCPCLGTEPGLGGSFNDPFTGRVPNTPDE